MQCAKCGYMMHGRETTCVCCGRVHSPSPDRPFPLPPAQRACPSCGRVQDAGSLQCPTCGINPAFRGSSRRTGALAPGHRQAVIISVTLAALVLGLGAWGVFAQQAQRREAVQQAQAQAAREARLAAALASLRAARPAAFFDRYPGDNNSVPFKARLTTCDVRGVTFSREDGADSLTVNVSLLGYKPDHQAPLVNVALYGEDGSLLAEKAIVEFTSADLEQGETREVKDVMDYPKNGAPVFVGINEGSADVTPAATAPPVPTLQPTEDTSSPTLPVSDETGYRDSMEAFKRVCATEGYVGIWPHDGDENVVGVLIDDNNYGYRSEEDKKTLAAGIGKSFIEIRQQNNQTGPCKAIVRFVPSGYIATITPRPTN